MKNTSDRHVLLVVQNNSFPMDKRVAKEARSFKAAGYEVTVVGPASELDPEFYAEVEGMQVWRYRNYESQGGVASCFWNTQMRG